MGDPTRDWSPRTTLAYETTRRLALSIIGDKPMSGLTRATCREFVETLRYLPKSASKRFPGLTLREAAERAQRDASPDVISACSANGYLTKVCVVLNWAVQEEFMPRNPMRGLRLADPVAARDKRLPFSDEQLRKIFDAPLFTGCENDGSGYARQGSNRPRGTRFWVTVIGMYSGLRLNEVCQLDVTDVRAIEEVECFVVTEQSLIGSADKRVKTRSSERIVPVHPALLDLGLKNFVHGRSAMFAGKLFGDICPGRDGFRSTAFSKWFGMFLEKAGASGSRTSYHSLRHNFRDALRQARVDRDIAMALGGWGVGRDTGDVFDNYGRGYRPELLLAEISKLAFPLFSFTA